MAAPIGLVDVASLMVGAGAAGRAMGFVAEGPPVLRRIVGAGAAAGGLTPTGGAGGVGAAGGAGAFAMG